MISLWQCIHDDSPSSCFFLSGDQLNESHMTIITCETNNNNQSFNASRDKLFSTVRLKLGKSNVRLRSIGQLFFNESDFVRSFSPSNLIVPLNSIDVDYRMVV